MNSSKKTWQILLRLTETETIYTKNHNLDAATDREKFSLENQRSVVTSHQETNENIAKKHHRAIEKTKI